MKIFNQDDKNRDIAHYIFSGSTTMIGVCITVIALFKVMKTNLQTYADELLGFDTLFFIISALFSYAALRKNNNIIPEKIADVFFFLGMLLVLVVAFMIIYATY